MRVTGYYIGYLMCRLASPVIEYIVKLQGSELNLCAICFYYYYFLLFPVVMLLLRRIITMHISISMFIDCYCDEGDSLKL